MASGSGIPSVGQSVPVLAEGAGAGFPSALMRCVRGISGTPGWGDGSALLVRTMDKGQTELLLLM